MASRGLQRALTVLRALPTVLRNRIAPAGHDTPQRILIAQLLLLGDTLMLAPLIAKLRARYPAAQIVLTCPPAFLPLFATRPWGVEALGFDLRDTAALSRLRAHGPFDLAVVPADNRFSWLAAAAGARRIVAFAGDARWRKNLPVTEFRPLPSAPTAFGDFAASLVDGDPPPPYRVGDWPAPAARPFDRPANPYAVIHLGASSPHKLWPVERWREAIAWLQARGLSVVLACGRGEDKLMNEVDPTQQCLRYAGTLDLAQYWALLAGARVLLCPDTGIAHLARLAGTPTVALFGPGSPVLFGAGQFWRNMPYVGLWESDIPCRDQQAVFEKPLPWARQCWRTPAQCGNPKCIRAVSFDAARINIETLLENGRRAQP